VEEKEAEEKEAEEEKAKAETKPDSFHTIREGPLQLFTRQIARAIRVHGIEPVL
jgi:hypothetical protein